MSKKTIIDKFKAMFSDIENESTEESFVDMVTTDGGILRIKEEEIAEGVEVMVVDVDGVEAIAPAGEYTTEDKTITIDEEGKVVSIADIEAEEAPVEDVVVEEEMAEEVAEEVTEEVVEEEATEEVVEEVNETESRLDALEKAIANIAENMSAVEALEAKVAELSGEPADTEVKLSKSAMAPKENKFGDKFSKLKELSKYRK